MRSLASTSDTSVIWRRAFSLANVEPVRLVAPRWPGSRTNKREYK